MTPEQVLDRRREAVLRFDADAFAELFAPDGVIESPFASPGMPARLEGREAIREFGRQLARSPLRIDDLEMVAVHETADPEVVITETITTGTAHERPIAARSVGVFRIRDGQIVLFRDYADPRVLVD